VNRINNAESHFLNTDFTDKFKQDFFAQLAGLKDKIKLFLPHTHPSRICPRAFENAIDSQNEKTPVVQLQCQIWHSFLMNKAFPCGIEMDSGEFDGGHQSCWSEEISF
jgi:hypothetical protein